MVYKVYMFQAGRRVTGSISTVILPVQSREPAQGVGDKLSFVDIYKHTV